MDSSDRNDLYCNSWNTQQTQTHNKLNSQQCSNTNTHTHIHASLFCDEYKMTFQFSFSLLWCYGTRIPNQLFPSFPTSCLSLHLPQNEEMQIEASNLPSLLKVDDCSVSATHLCSYVCVFDVIFEMPVCVCEFAYECRCCKCFNLFRHETKVRMYSF